MTPLMKAAANNRAAVCQLLLEKGADLETEVRALPSNLGSLTQTTMPTRVHSHSIDHG